MGVVVVARRARHSAAWNRLKGKRRGKEKKKNKGNHPERWIFTASAREE